MSARTEAIDRLRAGARDGAAGTAPEADGFACPWCVRPDHPAAARVPVVDADTGEVIDPRDLQELRNSRRFEHLLRDFATAGQLREHLRARARHWARDSAEEARLVAGIGATIATWESARDRIRRLEQRQQRIGGLT